jgi:hypothetical protein
VHLFPCSTDGRSHDEPFYDVMGFAPTDHGLGSICRVSQKQVVNVAQRGGLAPVFVERIGPTDLQQLGANARARRAGARGARRDDQEAPRSRRGDSLLEWDEETYRPGARPTAAPRSSASSKACGTSCSRATGSAT